MCVVSERPTHASEWHMSSDTLYREFREHGRFGLSLGGVFDDLGTHVDILIGSAVSHPKSRSFRRIAELIGPRCDSDICDRND